MVCVRCGARLGVGKLICERCGTAVGVNEDAVKNVSVKKLETGDLIYFLPEKPPQEKPAVIPAPLESIALPTIKSEAPPPYPLKTNTAPSGEAETRKTIFKYMSESKSRLEEMKTADDVKLSEKVKTAEEVEPAEEAESAEEMEPVEEVVPASAEPINIEAENAAYIKTADKPEDTDEDNFWGDIDELEAGLRTAAETINKGESVEETEIFESPKAEPKEAFAEEDNDLAAAPREFLYRTEYKKSAEAMAESPNTDYEFKAPLGMKTVSPELLSLFESPKEKSMTAGEWIWTIVLLLIPGINLISLFVWALGGCKKNQKTLFARAFLILILILAVIFAIVYFVFFRNTIRLNTGFFYAALDGASGIIQRISTSIRGIFR